MSSSRLARALLSAASLFAAAGQGPCALASASASPADPNAGITQQKPAGAAPWRPAPGSTAQQDPKALEVLKAGLKALGGEEAILGRKTIYVKRKVVNHEYPDPREGTILIHFKRPDKLRKEVIYPGRKTIEILDGQRAWIDDGSGPREKGSTLTAAMLDGLKEMDVPANYLDAELTYFNISQEIPGKLAHVVKARKNGYTRELMFDVNTNLLEVSAEYESPWGATDKMVRYERYRPVDGILFPYHEERWRSNRIILESDVIEVKFNSPMEDSLFQMPGVPAPAGTR